MGKAGSSEERKSMSRIVAASRSPDCGGSGGGGGDGGGVIPMPAHPHPPQNTVSATDSKCDHYLKILLCHFKIQIWKKRAL